MMKEKNLSNKYLYLFQIKTLYDDRGVVIKRENKNTK